MNRLSNSGLYAQIFIKVTPKKACLDYPKPAFEQIIKKPSSIDKTLEQTVPSSRSLAAAYVPDDLAVVALSLLRKQRNTFFRLVYKKSIFLLTIGPSCLVTLALGV